MLENSISPKNFSDDKTCYVGISYPKFYRLYKVGRTGYVYVYQVLSCVKY
jgi:hypothetical protein